MGLRIQAFLLGVSLTFISTFASALGLGEISIHSTLNQPLDAEVELLQVRSLTEQDLVVGLAPHDAFERAGVDKTHFILDLKFDIDFDHPQGARVKITSTKPVREPFLNFIIQAQWPSGRLLREYTVLVDLPVFSGAKSTSVNTAAKARPSAPTQTESRPTYNRPSQPAQTTSRRPSAPSYDGETYGPVKSSDTLWDIAVRVRPNQDVSVQQTMLAIQRLNPNAFIKNNINLLRRGQVLRVPNYNEITELSSREAIREVANQNRSWNNRDEQFDEGGAQLEGSKTYTATSTEQSQPEGRVKLSSRESFSGSESGRGLGEGEGTGQIEAALSATQEELDAARRENSELTDRLRSMEEQVETMEKLLEVSNEEMRALELTAVTTNEEAGTEEQTAEESSDVATEETAEATKPETEPAAKPETKPTPPAPVKQKSIVDLLMENILYIGIGIGALVLVVVAFIFMRGREDNFDDDDFEDFEPTFTQDEPSSDEDFGGDGELEIEGDDDETVIAGFDDDQPLLPDEELSAEAETEDVVAECDIHIAYGQYDQAEEKLVGALESEPQNAGMRLKLLEVFAAQNAAAEFDSHYAKLRSLGDADAIERAGQLRESIDGIGPFDETAFSTSTDEIGSTDTELAFSEEDMGASDLGDDTLNFDFDTDDTTLVAEPVAGDETSLSLETDDLEFDLELDSETPAESADTELSLEPLEAADDTISLDDIDDLASDDLTLESSAGESDSTGLDFDLEKDDSSDEPLELALEDNVDDISFDLDDEDLDLDFDDVELDVDLGDLDEPKDSFDGLAETDDKSLLTSDDDVTQIRGLDDKAEESLLDEEIPSFDFDNSFESDTEQSESDVASAAEESFELSLEVNDDDITQIRSDDKGSDLAASDTLEPELELNLDDDLDSISSAETTESGAEDELPEFDFDAELDAVLESETNKDDIGSLAENFAEDGDGGLDFSEFETDGVAAASDSSMEEPDLSFEGLEDDTELDSVEVEESAEVEESSLELESLDSTANTDSEEKATDFEAEVDLDSDFNLDELDQELDELASDFTGDISALEESDIEPETSAAEPELDIALEPEESEDLTELSPAESASELELEPLEDELPELETSAAEAPEPEPEKEEQAFSGDSIDESEIELGEQSLDAAVSSMDFEIPDFDPEEDDDSNLGFLSDSDETATKLDLARAYIDMGDSDGAKDILDEIMEEGNDDQKREAETLLAKMG